MTTLEIRDLHVNVKQSDADAEPISILKGVDLTVASGETHAIMGPNGSGKSTLSYAIAGHPKYEVTQGSITLDGVSLTVVDAPRLLAAATARGAYRSDTQVYLGGMRINLV